MFTISIDQGMRVSNGLLCIISMFTLLSCGDSESSEVSLRFRGNVVLHETGQFLSDVTVIVITFGTNIETDQPITEKDTLTTDVFGNYELIKIMDRSRKDLTRYAIYLIGPGMFVSTCSITGGLVVDYNGMDELVHVPRPVSIQDWNERHHRMCQVGDVQIVASKASPGNLDSLYYYQTVKSIDRSIEGPSGATGLPYFEKKFSYYTASAKSVEFKFIIKKSDGTSSQSTQVISLEPAITKDIVVTY